MAETPLNHTPFRDSFGSVEGSLDKPSQGHAAPFAVYPDEASRGVPCDVSDEARGFQCPTLVDAPRMTTDT